MEKRWDEGGWFYVGEVTKEEQVVPGTFEGRWSFKLNAETWLQHDEHRPFFLEIDWHGVLDTIGAVMLPKRNLGRHRKKFEGLAGAMTRSRQIPN